jgi:hypothetical protein
MVDYIVYTFAFMGGSSITTLFVQLITIFLIHLGVIDFFVQTIFLKKIHHHRKHLINIHIQDRSPY